MADFKNTKEGRNVAQKYADILHLSRPEPPVKYPRMALSNRAKIFSPFAALRGFDDEISSEGASKLLVKKVELSDEEKNTLSDKLLQVKKGMKVVVRYIYKLWQFINAASTNDFANGRDAIIVFAAGKTGDAVLFSIDPHASEF